MNIKQIQSKINLIKAQMQQLTDSGMFSKEEIERLSKPHTLELEKWEAEKDRLTSLETNVHGPEIL